MVLEAIFGTDTIKNKPWIMFFDSFILASISLWVSFYVFPQSASVLTLAFITIASVPMFHKFFMEEEEEDALQEGHFLTRHMDLVTVYSWFFIGLAVCFSFWYFALPSSAGQLCLTENCITLPAKEIVFLEQENTINQIEKLGSMLSGGLTGNAVGSGCASFGEYFGIIFVNNAFVLLLSIIFSFLYGAGALFLIGWNASVLAVKIGKGATALLSNYAHMGHGSIPISYLHGLFNALGFLPHGIFEITGFFVGAIAGGIISVAMTKKKYRTHEFGIVARDSLLLILFALALVFIGAVVESFLLSASCTA